MMTLHKFKRLTLPASLSVLSVVGFHQKALASLDMSDEDIAKLERQVRIKKLMLENEKVESDTKNFQKMNEINAEKMYLQAVLDKESLSRQSKIAAKKEALELEKLESEVTEKKESLSHQSKVAAKKAELELEKLEWEVTGKKERINLQSKVATKKAELELKKLEWEVTEKQVNTAKTLQELKLKTLSQASEIREREAKTLHYHSDRALKDHQLKVNQQRDGESMFGMIYHSWITGRDFSDTGSQAHKKMQKIEGESNRSVNALEDSVENLDRALENLRIISPNQRRSLQAPYVFQDLDEEDSISDDQAEDRKNNLTKNRKNYNEKSSLVKEYKKKY